MCRGYFRVHFADVPDVAVQLILRLATRMRRLLRILYMLHATFREGFQVRSLIECPGAMFNQTLSLGPRNRL